MGRLLRDDFQDRTSRCSICGKDSDHTNGYFIYNFKDLLAQSEEAQRAYEWFSSRNFDCSPWDVMDKGDKFTAEELAHIFVLEDFIERIMQENSVCMSCYKEKSTEKTTSVM